jgi:hypothetical protein
MLKGQQGYGQQRKPETGQRLRSRRDPDDRCDDEQRDQHATIPCVHAWRNG